VRTGNPGSGENRKSGIWWEPEIGLAKKSKHFIPPPPQGLLF
jgi:hypothetical protein